MVRVLTNAINLAEKYERQFVSPRDMLYLGEILQRHTVEEIRRSPVEVGSFSHHLQGFIHPRRCRIPSIKNMKWSKKTIRL